MKDFVRANLLKDKGEKVGMCAFLRDSMKNKT